MIKLENPKLDSICVILVRFINTMKIIHLLNSNKYSGAENVVCQIIDLFKSTPGIEMIYCSPDGQIKDVLVEKRIRFIPLVRLSVFEIKQVISAENPDIIHAHDFRASIIAVMATRKIAVISHIHNNSPWIKKYCINTFIYAFSCRFYKAILTVSDSIFDEFVFGDKFRQKLFVIGNPVNIKSIQEKTINNDNKKNYDLGFCGRLSYAKNPEAFLNLVEKLRTQNPEIAAAIIGTGEQEKMVVAQIHRKKLEQNITMFGFHKNPYHIMKSFKILCMPSRWEGFGLVAIEALALGVPVVCTNVGGLPEIVDESCGKVCEIDGFYEVCLEMLHNSALLKQKSDGALVKAKRLDNINQYYNNIIKIYNALSEAGGSNIEY